MERPGRRVDGRRELYYKGQIAVSENRPLEKLFNSITSSYDRMNRMLTLGMDGRWRRMAARAAALAVAHAAGRAADGGETAAVLDLCTGTGDLAFVLAEKLAGSASIVGLDFSPRMLKRAEQKRTGDPGNPKFLIADAAALPWEAASFDVVTVSFAFRNLTYHNPRMERTLLEIRRVLKPSGKLVILESSQPDLRALRFLRDIYVEIMVGKLAARLSGHTAAYRYLADSVKKYYAPSELRGVLRSAGFASVRYRPLLFGAAGLYIGS